jgi:hypothetical protein
MKRLKLRLRSLQKVDEVVVLIHNSKWKVDKENEDNKLAMSMGLELNLIKTYTRRIAHDKNRPHHLTSTKMTKKVWQHSSHQYVHK